jgi:hypothetical protein
MAIFRVRFDGKWQGNFDDQEEALAWGREVGETDRIVHVARLELLRTRLVAVFPESEAERGEWLWKMGMAGSDQGRGVDG